MLNINNLSDDSILNNQCGCGEMENRYNLEHINRLEIPIHLEPETGTFDDVVLHAHFRQRMAWGTIERNLRYARFMEKHHVPVNFRNPSFENFIQHMDYREQVEGAGFSIGKHEWQAMRMFLTAWGIPFGKGQKWYYKPPTEQETKTFRLLAPNEVSKLIKHTYHKDPYTNALVQYMLMHNFSIGWRVPSEPTVIKTSDVDIEQSLLTVTEPKKHYSTRTLIINDTLMKNIYRKSLKNWVDKWRPKVENQYSQDYLYLRPDGHPFQKDQLRMFLGRAVHPVNKDYHPNLSRYWCGTAIFINSILKTKTWDKTRVERQLGHEGRDKATDKYLRTAEIYLKLYPFDWFKRILKTPKKCEENTLKSIQNPKTPISSGTLRENTAPPTACNHRNRRKIRQKLAKKWVYRFLTPSLKSLFFSFYFFFVEV